MIKVFLVEDEFVVREGIKNNIDWIGEGFHFCGDAADGELAYPRIQMEQPDILLTDIKMPFMNGLELSSLVKKELPQCKIIILSGHEEFAYAQEAIKIGVTEYLLKPISSAELLKVIKRVGNQVQRELLEKENFDRYQLEMKENDMEMRRRLFNELVGGKLSSAKMIEQAKLLELELSAQFYQIVLFKYSIIGNDETYSSELLEVNKEFGKINSAFSAENDQQKGAILFFDRAIEGWALLIKADTPQLIDQMREHYFQQVEEIFGKYEALHYFGGIGKCVDRLTRLSESYESSAHAFARRFILEKNRIVSCEEATDLGVSETNVLDVLALGNIDLKKAEAFLKSGEAQEITFFVEEFLKSVGKSSEKSVLFKQYILMNIYFTVFTFLEDLGGSEILTREPFAKQEEMQVVVNNPQKSKDYLVRIFTIALERRDALRKTGYHRLIEQAKKYMLEHYTDEDMSLNEIAAYVNISANHFSTVYSRETGNSFIKDLTDLRMNKAMELLKYSDLRCSDISETVGYKDPHYFSYLFKKIQNCSPMSYRNTWRQSK